MRVAAAIIVLVIGAVACSSKDDGSAIPAPDHTQSPGREFNVESVVGYWTGDWGEIYLTEAADGRITGAYRYDEGVVTGDLSGDTFVGRWCQAPYVDDVDRGPVEFRFLMIEGVPSIDGRWKYDADGAELGWREDWDLQERTAAAPPAELLDRANDMTKRCR